ncbi:aspartic proteinase 36 isoform X2 [Corylus avellana]|uniref:aspartic proteinase 36 isoform X1 n=1 Tax=Corylus avellana TaxID=13451 RepID=UPI001E20CD91|nr:aspartic proteinase 36 isoform X1 [Corylus avellana]XP_059428752.1 aspartic proteinase 36 isoform X2 [Corylus avellana]
MRGLVPLLAACAAVLVSVVYCVLPPTLLPLERAFPLTRRVELDRLRARDRARHARFLRGAVSGVVDFSVQGSSDPYFVGYDWLYFTKVKLGSPPREFNVQIDTGSDILWVTCNSCSDCPQSSGLGVQLNFFDAASSSTAAVVPCSDPMCTSALQTAATQCSPQSNQCSYSFQYGDGSGTSGYYVSDALYFDMVLGQSLIANSSAPIVFGCSTYQSGDLTKTDKAVDGIFGFGQGDLSVISQLSSRAITPKVFSHCLKGGGNGGGILVLGEILEPGIVYSPLVPSQPHYNLYLQSIAVNGQLLPIDPAAFATSNNQGTIVDSGTTLAYLVDEAYDPFVSSITAIVQQSVTPTISNGNQCYLVSTSVNEIFPPVSLNFAGSASMVLKPEEYLVHIGFSGGAAMWCIGFQRVQEGVTILGDLVLKDKIIVYDLARQRIGWANYDCSLSVNVSVTSGKEFLNEGQLSVSSSSREILFELLPMGIMGLLLHLLA